MSKQICCWCGCVRRSRSLWGKAPRDEDGNIIHGKYHDICDDICSKCGRDCTQEFYEDGRPYKLKHCDNSDGCFHKE